MPTKVDNFLNKQRPLLAEAVSKRKIAKVGGKLHRLQRFSDADMGNQCLI